MTIYAPSVENAKFSPGMREQVPDVPLADEARRRRDRDLTMAERLERAHRLCAQLARLRPVDRKPRT